MFRKDRFKPRFPITGLALFGMLIASCVSPSFASAATVFCELASLPVVPLSSDLSERLPPEELLERVAESYRGLLEFGGEGISEVRLQSLLLELTSPEKFFKPVPGRDQRSVALNESLAKLGDWVMLEAEDLGLTQPMIAARLREVVRAHLGQVQEEQERVEETREGQRNIGVQTQTGHVFYRDTRFPELGDAWLDPDGMVWGDVAKKEDGSNRKMNHADALAYCRSIGAELPSLEDFIRLRNYMDAQLGTSRGYMPQILPGLTSSSYFWSSTYSDSSSKGAHCFDGVKGELDSVHTPYISGSVRCVRRPETGDAQ